MSETVDLDREILALTDAAWRQSGGPILLSSLGGRLSDGAKVLVRASNIPLRRYIQTHLSDQLRIIPMPAEGGGVAPKREVEKFSDEELVSLYRDVAGRQRAPRYQPGVWRGFRQSIPESFQRYIIIDPDGRVYTRDIPEGELPPPQSTEITRADLPSIEDGEDCAPPNKIEEAIDRWRQKHDIDIEKLTMSRDRQHGAERVVTKPTAGQPFTRDIGRRPNLLELVEGLRVFTRDELARIQIPADIVLSILERAKSR